MKLIEMLSPEEIEERFVSSATKHGFGERTPEFTFLVHQMMKNNPEFTHEGTTYRIIALPLKVVLESERPSDVLKHIRSNITHPHDVISWSKKIKGAIRYHNLVMPKLSSSSDRVFVILEQVGKGFDYRPWIKSYHHEREKQAGMLYSNVQVYEVLAPFTTNARIGMFFISEGSDYLKFTPDNFQHLKDVLSNKASDVSSHVNIKSKYFKKTKTLSRDKRKSKVGRDYYDL